ncbi:GerMN domain-containing protein [Luteococcus sp. Sow4_B9]|uniref:GerMN domain-containing protein n=1 Tax=Luteococcus sp. Sow4_B9 TaxID=3438792 RepID=UPI003F98F9F0
MTRRRQPALLLVAVLAVSACSTVPSSGPVERVNPPVQAPLEGGVDVHPVPPQRDASPDAVLAGYLDAMASLEPGFTVARQYLTPAAARRWDPSTGVTVFDGDTRSSLPGSTKAGIQARVVGSLDAQGHYRAETGRILRQDFTMEQVAGQWRISNPPSGLLVSHYTLLHRFTPTPVWFFVPGSSTLVPERVWLARNPAGPAEAVRALLAGPSEWMAPAVDTAVPNGTRLAEPGVTVIDGIATIPLEGRLGSLPDPRRTQLLAQLGWTLRAFPELRGLRVVVDSRQWGTQSHGLSAPVMLEDLPGLPPVPIDANEQPFAVVDGAVGRLDEQGSFSPLGGVLGTRGWGGRAGSLAVSSSSSVIAVVNQEGTQLHSTRLGRDELALRLVAKKVENPVVTSSGTVWASTGGDAASALWRSSDGATRLKRVAIPELSGSTLVAFAVSPEQTRLAVVLRRGQQTSLGLLRIRAGTVDGLRILPLQQGQIRLEEVKDVGWTGAEQLMVLASQGDDSPTSAYLVGSDGSHVEDVGPAGELDLVQLDTRPQDDGAVALLRSAEGQVLRYQSAWRWQSLPGRVSWLAVPS